MVAETRMPDDRGAQAVRVEDIMPLSSRVSWPAIFAGAVLALAFFFVLTLLGGAVGLSVYDRVSPRTLNMGAAIWAIISTILSLFLGGYFVSQATVGENKCEAAVHGILMWGVTFAMIIALAAMGVRAGFSAMVGVASINDRTEGSMRANWETYAREAGVTQEQLNDWHKAAAQANNGQNRDVLNDPAERERVAAASWWTLFGVLLSMAAAIGGALLGAGPTFRLMAASGQLRTTGRTVRETVQS